jgi:UDP-GlcNAc:undecaprenyl-phosphate GlcNAc-1-phosphate transferase
MLALGTFLGSFLLAYLGTILLLRLRLRERFVDVPNERSSHEIPKPRFGGIAIVSTFLLAYIFLLLIEPGTRQFLPLLLGGAIVFGAGVWDDWRSLSVAWRFAAQLAAVAVVVASGHAVDHIYLPLVGTLELGVTAIPFTILFILTSINFYNFIDGIDGLAAGSAFITSSFLALIAYMLGHVPLALVCLAVAGSTVAFLQFNFPPSRLFMGDSGSTFLGFLFAYVAIAGNGLRPELPFFIPVLILSSLYVDAGLTLLKRAVRGERIFQPHHTHYYQRLLSLGLNHKQVTVLEYALTILLGISAVIFVKAGGLFPVFITLCWVVVFAALILKIQGLERGDRLFWERRSVLVVAGDILMIAVAYFGAYFLRMGFQFTEPEGTAVVQAFPFVLVVRSACFFRYGLYRGVWKYTSTPDIVRIIKAVTTGSVIILALVVLFYRFVAFPRSLFVIEYFLLISALCGSRFAFRLFHEFGKEAHGANVRRVAIIGAGDYGERLAREIRNDEGKSVSVVCYIDDDESKQGLVLQGVPIVGPIDSLADICNRFDVHALVLGISKPSDTKVKTIVREAREAGVHVETRARVGRPAAGLIELDRVRRELGRDLSVEPTRSTREFYRGKRVLLTNGGEDIGPQLAAELSRLGAVVFVQVDGRGEADRFDGIPGSGRRVSVGDIERELDAARLLDSVRPQVVFHCASLVTGEMLNRDQYLWRKLVRTASALRLTLPRSPVSSLVAVNFWGETVPEDFAAHASAAAEIMLLNCSDLARTAPKVLRLPTILTGRELAGLIGGTREINDASYSLLETEAVSMVLDAGAVYKGRVILVPRPEAPISASQLPSILGAARTVHRLPPTQGEARLFPNEELKASVLRSAQEVVSPSYPASEELLELATGYARSTSAAWKRQFTDLHAALFERSRSVRSSSD